MAEIRPRSGCILFPSRRELNIADKKGSVCVCVCVGGEREKHLGKGECFRKPQTMYHLHTAGCMSDTGPLL